MKNIVIAAFAVMVVAQWYAPVSMILDSEETIEQGQEFKFRTRPVDPSDPFRGKYITLDFDAENYTPLDTVELYQVENQNVLAIIGTDSLGFAKIEMLTNDPPEGYSNYITVLYNYRYEKSATLEFPFKRFYLEESKASEAEQLYWQARNDSNVVYAKVKVYKGNAKLTDVMVNDSSIVDVVRRINAKKPD